MLRIRVWRPRKLFLASRLTAVVFAFKWMWKEQINTKMKTGIVTKLMNGSWKWNFMLQKTICNNEIRFLRWCDYWFHNVGNLITASRLIKIVRYHQSKKPWYNLTLKSDDRLKKDMLYWVKWLRIPEHRLTATLEVTGSNPGPGKINF